MENITISGTAVPSRIIFQAAEANLIASYDVNEKRAWLVHASEVMLHMQQHRYQLKPFEVDGNRFTLDTSIKVTTSARTIMRARKSLVLLEDDHHTFEDEILNIWSLLERLLDPNVARQRNAAGAPIKGTLQDVYGYEFRAVVLERSPF
jgi:flagellar basal body P-ring protein FlgI